jgi:hypothetical protein
MGVGDSDCGPIAGSFTGSISPPHATRSKTIAKQYEMVFLLILQAFLLSITFLLSSGSPQPASVQDLLHVQSRNFLHIF